MQVHVNTDNHIHGSERLFESITQEVQGVLGRFEDLITRVDVHLSDVNAHKGPGVDKRCLIEARVAGIQPVVAHDQSATVHEAVAGASEKLFRLLETTLAKHRTARGPQVSASGQTTP
ncbi:HPF/RaiA family ribosome-associated protein [Aquisphaera insulae]|uniref:HPF/RaiA family ribosome-associated protein n=1 Tax=Aquisphaera insulae TaxID=2712864 RepID=UPI0013EA9C86|nr:HPF/RaiA family ribosome-associated protein [Aquisphaera insulae]